MPVSSSSTDSPSADTNPHPLEQLFHQLPQQPGVYLHKDAQGRVLYIGKAKSLRHRVRSYFQPSAKLEPRLTAMVRQVRDVETLCTASETEALILEANLIKKHRPRYNVHFKDDKSYPFFKLTVGEPYPRLYLTREKRETNAEYYGPFANVSDARETLRALQRHFRLRTSKMYLDGSKTYRPCINYQLKRCLAPCKGDVPRHQYQQAVKKVRLFFSGRDKELLAHLQQEMQSYSEHQRYREAARARDALHAVQRLLKRQRVVLPDEKTEVDVFGFSRQYGLVGIQIMFVRGGRLLGSDFQLLQPGSERTDEQLLGAFLSRFYSRPHIVAPKEIWTAISFADAPILKKWLLQSNAQNVKILTPKRGKRADLLRLAQENAAQQLKRRLAGKLENEQLLQELRRTLKLRHIPQYIEACDVSNLQGQHSIAAVVCWHHSQPLKSQYRCYRMHKHQPSPTHTPNDVAAVYETISRHYQKKLQQQQLLPQLLLIDGGKAQVNAALQALKDLHIPPAAMDICGLAKGRSLKRQLKSSPRYSSSSIQSEYLVFPLRKNPLYLPANSPCLFLLQRIRDEAHRFALHSHQKLRSKHTLTSALEKIPGIGQQRAVLLLKTIGSLKRIQTASLQQLEDVPGLPKSLALKLHQHFQPTLSSAAVKNPAR